ncbi:coiled-coil domain-containing protein mad1 [Linderina pennispora]|nr:coiled-coil domain-containing protein mad1 [Linderina pennispora]
MERFEELEKEAARLEHQIGSGLGYNPRTTRILQLKDNPSAQDYAIRSEKLKALVAENESLLAHIKKLTDTPSADKSESANDNEEDSGEPEDPPSGSPFFQTIANLRTENQELAKQLENSVILMRRYKKEWRRKVFELREAVYSIMGYRLDFLSNGGVRCTSTYASDIGQSFVFKSGDDNKGDMKLYGGGNKEYLNSIMNDIRYWIQERGSIPGFLATVTLQNFETSQQDPPLVKS